MTIITQKQTKNKYWPIWSDDQALLRRIKNTLLRYGIKSRLVDTELRIRANKKKALPLILKSDSLQDIGNYFECKSSTPGHYDLYAFVADDDPEFADWEVVGEGE